MFSAELGEICVRGCRVGFEVEAVPRFTRCCGRNGDLRRTLIEVATELVRRVAEPDHAPRDPAPLDFHRANDGAKNSQTMGRVKAVGNCKDVEYGADIVDKQPGGPGSDIYFSATTRITSNPKSKRASHDAGVV